MGRWQRHALLLVVAVVACAITVARTELRSPSEVLGAQTWGAGPFSTSQIIAFATLRKWWVRYTPECVVRDGDGIVAVTRAPRSDVRATGELVLADRGIGHMAFLGLLTAARSAFSRELIFDFPLYVRAQQALTVLALGFSVVGLRLAHPQLWTRRAIVAWGATYALVFLLEPISRARIVDGLIDSALAAPLAIAGAMSLARLTAPGRASKGEAALGGLVIGACALVRGEIFFALGFAWLALLIVFWRDREVARRLLVAAAVLASVPLAQGLLNLGIYGHFIPLRLQGGQNLFEPIGQFDNPWGIVFTDEWVADHLAEHGLGYRTYEADTYMAGRYAAFLREHPEIFVRNFGTRMATFFWPLPAAAAVVVFFAGLVATGVATRYDRRLGVVAAPLFVAAGLTLILAWTNSLPRLRPPVGMLIRVALPLFAAYAVTAGGALWRARDRGALSRRGAHPVARD